MRPKIPTRLFLTLVLAAGFTGCTSTRASSFKDPDYRTRGFGRLVVLADIHDLLARQEIERRMVEALKGQKVQGVASVEVIPPTRELPLDLIRQLMLEEGHEGMIWVRPLNDGEERGHLALTSVTPTHGNTSATQLVRGGAAAKPWANFDVKLIDLATGHTAWISSSHTAGTQGTDITKLVSALAERTVADLKQADLLQEGVPPLPFQERPTIPAIEKRIAETRSGAVPVVPKDQAECAGELRRMRPETSGPFVALVCQCLARAQATLTSDQAARCMESARTSLAP